MSVLDTVFDCSHFQATVDFATAKTGGMQAVLLKATQGTSYVDPMYVKNGQAASDAGLLVGSYHFGIDDDGTPQADHFLEVAYAGVLVLDFETMYKGGKPVPSMNITQAGDFVQRVYDKRGHWPVLYADRGHAAQLATVPTIVQNCPLWLARYDNPANHPPPPLGWINGYVMWQYTQTGTVPGVKGNCDRSMFFGEDIDIWWKNQY